MNAQHTPGTWTVGRLGCGDVYVASGTVFVARINDEPETEANARLIAAAPKLLDNCIRALAAWEGTGPAIALDDLRAAIAEATGSAA